MAAAPADRTSPYYEDIGHGDPPIVFIHGIGNHTHFARQIEYFSQRHRVIAPDLPGFGRSKPSEHDYSIAALAADVAGLCDGLDLRDAILVGHSMGGACAIEVAAARPELSSAIVLVDPIPVVPLPGRREQMAPLVAAVDGDGYPQAFRAFAESRMFLPTDDADLRLRVVDEMCATSQPVLAATLASIMIWTGEVTAERIHVPVLLITAGDGVPSDVARLRDVLPKLELGRTIGAGHFAHLIAVDQVNAMIDRFLTVNALSPAAAQPAAARRGSGDL